jgi:hypothetical protein
VRRKNILSAVEYYKGLKNKVLGMRTKKNEEDIEKTGYGLATGRT